MPAMGLLPVLHSESSWRPGARAHWSLSKVKNFHRCISSPAPTLAKRNGPACPSLYNSSSCSESSQTRQFSCTDKWTNWVQPFPQSWKLFHRLTKSCRQTRYQNSRWRIEFSWALISRHPSKRREWRWSPRLHFLRFPKLDYDRKLQL